MIKVAPRFGVLTTNFDDPTAAVEAGQTFERMSLEGTLHGVSVYPAFHLTEISDMCQSVQSLFPELKGFPQLIFAKGYPAEEVQHSAPLRIPLNQVMRPM